MNKDKVWVIGPTDEERMWRETVVHDMKTLNTKIIGLAKFCIFLSLLSFISFIGFLYMAVF